MRHFGLIICLIGVAALMSSCANNVPSQAELNNYLTALRQYYPYSADEELVFVNDSTGQTWEGVPYVKYANAGCLHEETYYCKSVGASCYGDWSASIDFETETKGMPALQYGGGGIHSYITYCGGGPMLMWNVEILLSPETTVVAGGMFDCSKVNVYSYLTDTIILPIPSRHIIAAPITKPEGAYARIVKHQGLTDFSVDGKTVWKRVKE